MNKSLNGTTTTEHKEPLCHIFTHYELLSSWILIWQIEPCSSFLGRVGHWLCNSAWSWSLLVHSFAPAKLKALRGFSVTAKHFRVSNFPFYIGLCKKSATLPSPPLQNIGMMSADNYPVLSWALHLQHQFVNSSLPPKCFQVMVHTLCLGCNNSCCFS